MSKIIGNTTATPNPQPDWNQDNSAKADFIKNKPQISVMISTAETRANDYTDGAVDAVQKTLNEYIESNDAELESIKQTHTADKENIDDALSNRYTKEEADNKFALITDATSISDRVKAIEDDYLVEADKTGLAGIIIAEKERAESIEGGLRADVNTISADYLKTSDKTELQGNIDTVSSAVERLTNGVSADEIDGVNDLINYVNEHGPEVTGMKKDIVSNTKAISDEIIRADAAEKALDGRIKTLEAIDHSAYVASDAALKTELQNYVDSAISSAITTALNTEV